MRESRCETKLVTLDGYNADTGRQETVTDSADRIAKTFEDDLGRTTHRAENYDNFNASTEANTGDATDKSKDWITKFTYNALGRTKLIAMDANADGNLSDNQATTYLFEDAVNASVTTNEIYPDSLDSTSTGTDHVKVAYNLDGSPARTDQRGTVIGYTVTKSYQSHEGAVDTGTAPKVQYAYDATADTAVLTRQHMP